MLRRIVIGFIALCSVLVGGEIPQEENLQIGILDNGLTYWIRKHTLPAHVVALKVIWKVGGQPNSYGTEIPYADRDDLRSFFEFCREKIDPRSESVAVIAVGNFSDEDIYDALHTGFHDMALMPLSSGGKGVSVEILENLDHIEVALRYPTPPTKIETLADLRHQWALFFLQNLLLQKVQTTLQLGNAISMPVGDSRFCLPRGEAAMRARCGWDSYLKVLSSYLTAVQEIRKKGFSEEELAVAKGIAQKRLLLSFRDKPDSGTLVEYYADQIAYGVGCPAYADYFALSKNAIAEVSLPEIQSLLTQCIREEARHITVSGPQAIQEAQEQIIAVANGASPDGVTDPYGKLLITEEEKGMLRTIVDTLANTTVIMLPFYKDELEDLGRRVNHVHPLRFLGTIFADPYLKKCMASIKDSYFKWKGFVDGLSRRIEEEYSRDNLSLYIRGFCKTVGADPDQVRIFIQKRNWEGLVAFLIEAD